MIYGFDFDGLMAILGKAVVANNRLLLDLEAKDKQIQELKQQLEEAYAKLGSKDERLESSDTRRSIQ